ncbi:Importin subunit alpha-3-like 2 [Homarus americanus]|uniref:Importin subunit alpha-3-like 2 n=1 Tax=Homarus americanus TaxID=6706 RepID=A0A8J5JG89_HOMAM|nr:Importin subunit alpha-3-like 2 [Homarus americanus]
MSFRHPSTIRLTPAMQRRFSKENEKKKSTKVNEEKLNLKSIRERRERLQAILQSRRLPPLMPTPSSSRSNSNTKNPHQPSNMTLSPHWKEKEQPKPERQPTPQPNISNLRLTPLPSRGGHSDRLPDIRQGQEQEQPDDDVQRPATQEHLQQMHDQMTQDIQQLMQQQMQQMQQLLNQKKEQQLRKQKKQEQLEQEHMQQRAQEAHEEENRKRTEEEEKPQEQPETGESTTPTADEGATADTAADTAADKTQEKEDTSQEAAANVEEKHEKEDQEGATTEEGGEREGEEEEGVGQEAEEDDISDEVNDIVEGIKSGDYRLQLSNTERARVHLSSNNPPTNQFIRAGILPPLIACMEKGDSPELQMEAAWAVTNIASGTSDHTWAVVDSGAVGVLVRLLSSPDMGVKEQAVWALGNIVGDGAECRDRAIQEGIIRPLINLLYVTMPLSLRRQVCWVITNLFRVKNPIVSPEERKECAHALKDLAITELVESGLVRDMVQRLYSDHDRVVTAALRATGSVAAGTNEQTDAVVQAGALPIYREMLSHTNPGVAREAAWILSNITAGTTRHIQLVMDVQVVPALISAVEKNDAELRKEATWALSNLTAGCSTEQVDVLVNTGVLKCLCGVLAGDDPGMVLVALDAINNIFKKTEKDEATARIVESYGGLETLKSLQSHQEMQISKMAKYLLKAYFQDGQEDEEEQEEKQQ